MLLSKQEVYVLDKDAAQNVYFMDPQRFADLINGYVGHGEQLISPQNLQNMDPRSGMYRIVDFEEKANFDYEREHRKKTKLRMRYRDIKKRAVFGRNALIIGLENQETIDYSMPVRVASSDTGEYESQVSMNRKRIRKQKTKNGLRAGEYLYGFRKKDRLQGVITFVIYYGEEEWDGARELRGLLDMTAIPGKLQRLVTNNVINLIEVRKIEDTSVFQTDIRQVFDFIRYSRDKEKLKELVESDPAYQDLAEDAYDVIVEYVNAWELLEQKDKVRGKDGKLNMCKALKELIADGRTEGENRVNKLYSYLIKRNRYEDLKRATKDSRYRKQLFTEFNL